MFSERVSYSLNIQLERNFCSSCFIDRNGSQFAGYTQLIPNQISKYKQIRHGGKVDRSVVTNED